MRHCSSQRLSKIYEKCLDGEYEICNKCDGTGKSPRFAYPCDKCWGQGILDWVERIVGKDCGRSASSSSVSSSQPTQKSVKNYIEEMKGKTI